mmetsp:Transcript_36954/g.147396  ORF Transcript_36954/g.147396 Transcript_36954/m.147396 type:complete len:82 (-) Transcript_36954:199-444(-)
MIFSQRFIIKSFTSQATCLMLLLANVCGKYSSPCLSASMRYGSSRSPEEGALLLMICMPILLLSAVGIQVHHHHTLILEPT